MTKSPLPWLITPEGEVRSIDGRLIVPKECVHPNDKAFLVHAVNVYPKFTHLLQDVMALPDHITNFDILAADVTLLLFPARRLLQEVNRFDRGTLMQTTPDREPP